MLSRYSRAHGLISFPWDVRDINQYVSRPRGGGGRRRVNVSLFSSSPLLLLHEKEGGASEGKARGGFNREERGMKGAEGFWKGPWWTRSPFLQGYPSLSSPLKSVSGPQVRFRISEIVAVGGTKRAFTSLWPISRRHHLNNHRTTNHQHSRRLYHRLLAAVSSLFLILLLLFSLQASPCGGYFYQLCPARPPPPPPFSRLNRRLVEECKVARLSTSFSFFFSFYIDIFLRGNNWIRRFSFPECKPTRRGEGGTRSRYRRVAGLLPMPRSFAACPLVSFFLFPFFSLPSFIPTSLSVVPLFSPFLSFAFHGENVIARGSDTF